MKFTELDHDSDLDDVVNPMYRAVTIVLPFLQYAPVVVSENRDKVAKSVYNLYVHFILEKKKNTTKQNCILMMH